MVSLLCWLGPSIDAAESAPDYMHFTNQAGGRNPRKQKLTSTQDPDMDVADAHEHLQALTSEAHAVRLCHVGMPMQACC